MRRFGLMAAVLAISLVLAVPVAAQNGETDPGDDFSNLSTLSFVLSFMTSTSSTLSGVATGYSLWGTRTGAVTAQLQRYIASHQADLEQDLALGYGPTIRDLAEMAQVAPEDMAEFGKFMRANRTALLDLANADTLTPERTQRFADRITAISVLAADAG